MKMRLKRTTSLILVLVFAVALSVIFSLNRRSVVEGDRVVAEIDKSLQTEETSLVADASLSEGDPQEAVDENVPKQPAVAAGAYLVSGKRLSGWKTDKRWPVASVTKLLSAHVAETNLEPTDRVALSEEAVATEGDAGLFQVGDTFQVRDLVKAMLMVSSNDAATALADHYGREKFVVEMNAVASRAGMSNSYFVEPTGLSVQNQATVEDLIKLAEYILQENPKLLDISKQSTDLIVDSNTGAIRQLTNINWFAGRADFIGGKTGRLPEADGNLLSVFAVPGFSEPVVIVVLGSKDRFGETQEILNKL